MTREILVRKVPGTGQVSHRLSLAAIGRDADFSSFAGFVRTIVLADGAGFTLDFHDGSAIEVTRRARRAEFDGGAPLRCTLLDGPVRVLNVMSARVISRHEVSIAELAGNSLEVGGRADADWIAICLSGSISLGAAVLEPADAAEWNGPATIHGEGTVALVSLSTLC